MAETKYSTARTISTRPPPEGIGRPPTAIEPTIVPISALATVKPSQKSVSANWTASEPVGGARDDGRVEAEQQPAQGATNVLPSK